jgi:hypothetical protein
MADLIVASSPVEIEAKVDETGFDKEVEAHALALFHELTSDLELLSLGLRKEYQAEWPKHRFYFARAPSSIAQALAALLRRPDAWRVEPAAHPEGRPAVLFLHREAGEFAAILVACRDADVLQTVSAGIEGSG